MVLNLRKFKNYLLVIIFISFCNYVLYLTQKELYKSVNIITTNENKKIDWHDYSFMEYESLRTGDGENGYPVILNNETENVEIQRLIEEFSYNVIASDKISLDRSIPDTRPEDCRSFKYLADVPPVSVIIVFHDEYLSFLLRTVHSVINRTPSRLLEEIILVDDCSTKGNTKDDLDWHLITTFPKANIRIVRLKQRHGLMKARMVGIMKSTSDIVVVMDAHMEVNTNWLPPLIEPIYVNSKTITEPTVDIIEWDTLTYVSSRDTRGGFLWGLTYDNLERTLKPGEKDSDNYDTPVILGAIAAFSKEYFWSIGGYDPGLHVWGGEQFDLSFKVWMCGGRVLKIPCSRVGHNFKGSGFHPYIYNSSMIYPNLNRIAEIWLDEYKDEFYAHSRSKNYNPGYILPQIELKKRLGCKSFKWYLETLLPDFLEKYPTDMSKFVAYGAIQSISNPGYCVDTLGDDAHKLGLYSCHSQNLTSSAVMGSQYFLLTIQNEIRLKKGLICWDVGQEPFTENYYQPVYLNQCHHEGGNQRFEYDRETQQIKAYESYCLEGNYENATAPELFITKCNTTSTDQQWKWHMNIQEINK